MGNSQGKGQWDSLGCGGGWACFHCRGWFHWALEDLPEAVSKGMEAPVTQISKLKQLSQHVQSPSCPSA